VSPEADSLFTLIYQGDYAVFNGASLSGYSFQVDLSFYLDSVSCL